MCDIMRLSIHHDQHNAPHCDRLQSLAKLYAIQYACIAYVSLINEKICWVLVIGIGLYEL